MSLPSAEDIFRRADDLPKRPVAVEAFWDGDTTGWFLTLTAVYTVLVEGSDMDEPVADEVRSILDGHIVLDRAAAQRGRYPAVAPLASVSRLMDRVAGAEHREAAAWFRENLALYEEHRDLITVGAYRKGADPRLDRAVAIAPDLEAYLAQERGEQPGFEDSVDALVRIWRESTKGGR